MENHRLHHQIFQLLHLFSLADLILSIIGRTNVFSNKPSVVSNGFTELKSATCLSLTVFVADIIITGYLFLKASHV